MNKIRLRVKMVFLKVWGYLSQKITLSKAAIILSVFLSVFVSIHLRDRDDWHNAVTSDGSGYYAFLPAVFIYHDLKYSFLDSLHENIKNETNAAYPNFLTKENGYVVNRFYAGTATMMMPFFLVSHLLSYPLHFQHNGYSLIYMYGLFVGNVIYLILGLIFLRKLLQLYSFSDFTVAITIIAFASGTNFLYYSSLCFSYSHVCSFFLITAFAYFSKKTIISPIKNYLLIAGVLIGFIVLVRPINLLIVFALPFLASNHIVFFNFIKKFLSMPLSVFYGILIALFIFSIQFITNKMSTGLFFVYNYGHTEITSFHFDNPRFSDVLFSYQKGLFVYTPLCLLSTLLALILIYSKPYLSISFLLFLALITYVFSSWGCWAYGGGYGMRPYIEFFSIFAIIFGISFNRANHFFKAILFSLTGFFIYYTLIQINQMRYNILHHSDMGKDRYWQIFLKTDPKLRCVFFREEGEHFTISNDKFLLRVCQNANVIQTENSDTCDLKQPPHFSNASKIDYNHKFSNQFSLNLDRFDGQYLETIIEVSFWAYSDTYMNNPMCVSSIEKIENPQWIQLPVNGELKELKKWQKVKCTFYPKPFTANKSTLINFYVLNSFDDPLYLGDLDICIYNKSKLKL